MTVAEWCVFLSLMLYLASIAAVKWLRSGRFDNAKPRDPAFYQDPIAARSLGAHQNGIESFPFFAVAVLLAEFRACPQNLINELAVLFVIVQLAGLGSPVGRGMCWPLEVGAAVSDSPLVGSWCNGAAGFVHLWTLAHSLLDDERFARLARQAAWGAYESAPAGGDLCCGFAGRAYSLLRLHQHTGEAQWLARARLLADRAAASIQSASLRRDSLYKGEIGVALLAAELDRPEYACMPLFAGEYRR